jgi:hypothetical protein
MICLDGESLAAGGHYEIEPDEDQPAHRLVSAPQLGNVAGHNDRFERHVIRVELVIDAASPIRSKMGESPIRMAMLRRSRPTDP